MLMVYLSAKLGRNDSRVGEYIRSIVRLLADDCVLYRNFKSKIWTPRTAKMTGIASHNGRPIGK